MPLHAAAPAPHPVCSCWEGTVVHVCDALCSPSGCNTECQKCPRYIKMGHEQSGVLLMRGISVAAEY